jgi:hypothetical protein
LVCIAIERKREDISIYLLDRDVDPNVDYNDKGYALDIAVDNLDENSPKHEIIIKKLLQNKATFKSDPQNEKAKKLTRFVVNFGDEKAIGKLKREWLELDQSP